MLFIANWADQAGVRSAVWRMQEDYYLSQMAIFRPGDVVIDVGAHVGVAAIYLAKKFPFITVYALEPEPHNYDCLQRNIALNGVTNVVAINKALSGDGRRRTLYAHARKGNGATLDATTASRWPVFHTVQVETVTLGQLFRDEGIAHCRMVKISALGAVRESLAAFSEPGGIDFLCGEVALEDCSRVRLETASWRVARHHFWRTVSGQGDQMVSSWLHQLPREREQRPERLSSVANG
jgi:FkbM family methyltransferase